MSTRIKRAERILAILMVFVCMVTLAPNYAFASEENDYEEEYTGESTEDNTEDVYEEEQSDDTMSDEQTTSNDEETERDTDETINTDETTDTNKTTKTDKTTNTDETTSNDTSDVVSSTESGTGNSSKIEWPKAPTISAKSAFLMDIKNGIVLYTKSSDETVHPGSLTKLMTALLLVENCEMTDEITFTSEGCAMVNDNSGNLDTKLSEKLTVEQCLYALLFESANDIAVQVAVHIAGTEEKFIEMMNKRAEELECTHTKFTNPTGLPDEDHVTTAHDLAMICKAAFANENFKKAASASEYTINATNMTDKARELKNTHPLMQFEKQGVSSEVSDLEENGDTEDTKAVSYEGFEGGKSGFSSTTGGTMASVVNRNDMELVTVILRGEEEKTTKDSVALFDYAYENFTTISLLNILTEVEGSTGIVPKGVSLDQLEKLELPDEATDTVCIRYYLGDNVVGKIDLSTEQWKAENGQESISPEEIDTKSVETKDGVIQSIQKDPEEIERLKKYLVLGMAVLALLAVSAIFIFAMVNRKNKKKRRNKKR